jgi:DNA-binding PadR family transcriptional regulator
MAAIEFPLRSMPSSDKNSRLVEVGASVEQVSKVDLMLLGLLLKRATYGYEIAEELSKPAMQPWVRLGRTSVYYALGRLAGKDLVSKHAERHGGRPERAVYSITDAGRRVFIGSLREALEQPGESMESFDVALFFSSYLENQQVRDGLAERWQALERLLQVTREAVAIARGSGDNGLVLVLQHRDKMLSAQIQYAQELVRYLATPHERQVGTVSGSLKDTLIQDVLRSLAIGTRTGVLQISGSAGSLAFLLEDGEVAGVGQVEARDVPERLRLVFSDLSGSYEFRENAPKPETFVPVEGLSAVILQGTRATVSWDLLRRMLPEERTLLEVVDGRDEEIIGVDLSEDERVLLSVLDGVRTPAELSRHQGWSTQRFASVAYPLWATGWVRRTDNRKRVLVTAIVEYLDRWAEMVQVVADVEGVTKVFADVSFAAQGADLLDFGAARLDLASVRFSSDIAGIADAGRQYAVLVRKAAAARLGRRFVDDAERGLKQHFGEDHLSVLAEFGIE